MTKHIHIHIHRAKTSDAGFEESKHKRAANGQFGSGGGGVAPAKKSATPAVAVKHANRGAGALAQLQAQSDAHLKAAGRGDLATKQTLRDKGAPAKKDAPANVALQLSERKKQLSEHQADMKSGKYSPDDMKIMREKEASLKRMIGNYESKVPAAKPKA